MASPQLQSLIQTLRSLPTRGDITIEQARAGLEVLSEIVKPAADVQCEPVDVDGVPGEWVAASNADPERIVYYLHGGGYTIGSIKSHREMVSRVSRATAARALLVEYRLAPENRFPAAVEDALSGYRWLISNGADPARMAIAGDSAGGGLTVATLVALRDAGDPLPAAAVCISPWVDMECLGESMRTKADVDPWVQYEPLVKQAEMYLAGADPRHPLAAPLYADLSGLPPLLIQVGTSETLLDDSTRLAERATAAGVDVTLDVWDEMIHVFQLFAFMLPEGQQAIDRIGEFVRERTPAGVTA
ncbi:MAG TPA: alpha/beta hydrolase [Dehalococcoidia bacterium]|nr:alpha/beta hydrolase [Dehalococcoidia bacterium]